MISSKWQIRLGVALLACSMTSSVFAFADDDARRAILDLRATVQQMKTDLSAARSSQIELLQKISDLNQQNRVLTGRIEELTNALDVEKRNSRTLFDSLDKRVTDQENRLASLEPKRVTLNGREYVIQAQEQRDFDAAQVALAHRDYKEASFLLNNFAQTWKSSLYRPEALYSLSVCQFSMENYREAIKTADSLIKVYPKNARVPDAKLLVGSAQAAVGSLKAAKATLERIIKEYPGTDAAKTASSRLQTLKGSKK